MLKSLSLYQGKSIYLYEYNILLQIWGSLIAVDIYDRKETKFDLTFDQTVEIEESFYPSPSFTKPLAELGGSLGLWLGVGLVQLSIFVINFVNVKSILH